ncbi:MAG TPA: hypothetical protein PKC28_15865 [Bdellovibrionales bacterium]|nr:hypothetical protein [Bdellovibrionales bacterium]
MRSLVLIAVTMFGGFAIADVKLKCPTGTEQIKEQFQGGGESFFCIKKAADGQNVKHGPAVGFKSPGVKGYEANFADGAKDGEFKLFYENGQVKEVAQLKAGKYGGPTTWYWENGKKKADGQYVNDAESGTWSFYDYNGKKIAHAPFKEAVAKFKQIQAEDEQRKAEVKCTYARCSVW